MTIAQELSFGYSPSSSASADFEDALNPLVFDDDFNTELGLADGDDDDDDQSLDPTSSLSTNGSKPKRSNNRKGPANADKRATHNAVERARRESLNGRFTVLAESLPTMRNIKRPSKAMIVNKALDFVYDAQMRERTLVQENNELRREVDQLRARLGMPPLPPPAPLPEARPATQSTMRKTRKAQSVSVSAPAKTSTTASSDSTSPTAAAANPTSPSIDGAYPSPSISSSSAAGSGSLPLYDPSGVAAFPALFAGAVASPATTTSAPSPADTLASAASPSVSNPYLPGFDPSTIAQAATPAPGAAFLNMFNPSVLQAHIAAQAGLVPPQALYNPQAASYLNNPALLFAMHQHHQNQQQQQAQQQQQQQQQHSPTSTNGGSPPSFGSFGQTADSSSLWAGTPPSWGPFSHSAATAVDGLSF
ncbi:hypothetical protein JCM10212_005879 [Sporobolomyces blumeae]